MAGPTYHLASLDAFRSLEEADLREIESKLETVPVPRGTALIRQGERADALYIVISGRFVVTLAGRADPVAEIGAGTPVGEIAFFNGGRRTATVTAARDSIVLRLTRFAFEDAVARNPGIWRSIVLALADRLEATTRRATIARTRPRTIAVVPAASTRLSPRFTAMLVGALALRGEAVTIGGADVRAILGMQADLDGGPATAWLNELEQRHESIVFVTDQNAKEWSQKAIRQADAILIVATVAAPGTGASKLNELERYALSIHKRPALRLVLVHDTSGRVSRTRDWLASRPVQMHHHVALDDPESFARLERFLSGRALGLVTAGGGAYCAVHPGIHEAFRQSGISFDIYGGTSGGAAMAAAFALGASNEDIERRVTDTFVTRRSFRRWTWPRYALLDHHVFDDALREHFTDIDITDMWLPFFAVSTNLSKNELHIHRDGPLWQAIRASGAIPGLLSPFFTSEGEVLVDGAVMDNVPVGPMHRIKAGPNVVIAFEPPPLERVPVDYQSLPSRRRMLASLMLPRVLGQLPGAPTARSVIMRALSASRHDVQSQLTAEDILLTPDLPSEMGVLDWSRHAELSQTARTFGLLEIERMRKTNHALLQEFGPARSSLAGESDMSRTD